MKNNHGLKIVAVLLLLFTLVSFAITPVVAVDDRDPFSVNDQRNYAKDGFMLKYDVNSSFTVPTGWEVIENYSDLIPGLLHMKLPANVSVRDAITYFSTVDGVIYAEPDYTSSTGPSETDEKRIYSGTRQDRIEVYYINKSGEHIPWNVIHDFNDYSIDYEEDVLLQIPEEMTLVEAIEYCNNCSNVYYTKPGSSYIRSVVYGDSHDIQDVETNLIYVVYNDNSSFRLPWAEIYNLSNMYKYCIPEGMTLADAYAYCNTIDDIVSIGFASIYHPANGGVVASPAIPCPVLGVIIGLFCAGVILIRRRK